MLENSKIISLIHTIKIDYSSNDFHFLNKQLERVRVKKPYENLSILQNIPFTKETLIKSEVLIQGGAELFFTSPTFMDPDFQLIEQFTNAGGKFISQEDVAGKTFDIHLDCAAELIRKTPPRIGTVEITGTGTYKYGQTAISYPVISVDQCVIKNLEGILGTGEAFLRAFKEITRETVIRGRTFMVFGYGKVGQGIAHYLKNDGAIITIVDTEQSILDKAAATGFNTINAANKSEIEKRAKDMFCIVTATGRKDIISDNYEKQCFGNKYLANMGADDEFGPEFQENEVLCRKKPINFSISTPTLPHYLDPVFYAHNMGVDLLLYSNLKAGLHAFPSFIAEEVVNEWKQIFNESY